MANIGVLAVIGVIGAGGFLITHQDSGDTPPKSTVSAATQAVSDQIDRDRAAATPRPTWDAPTVPPSVEYGYSPEAEKAAQDALNPSTDVLNPKAAKGSKKQTAAQKQAKQKAAKQPTQPKQKAAKQPKTTTVKATTTASPTAVPTAASTTATGGHMPSTMPKTVTAPNFVTHGVKIH